MAFQNVVGLAIICSFVGFLESISIDRALAMQTGFRRADPSQELVALGFANFFGSIFATFPVTGSFSRSSVKAQIGARTQAAGLVVAILMSIILTWMTQFLTYIPNNVIAAVIISALLGLFDFHAVWKVWKTDKRDFAVWGLTYFAVIFLGVELGIAFSVAISLLLLLFNQWIPHTAVLGKIPGTNIYRSLEQYPEAKAEGAPAPPPLRSRPPLCFARAERSLLLLCLIDRCLPRPLFTDTLPLPPLVSPPQARTWACLSLHSPCSLKIFPPSCLLTP